MIVIDGWQLEVYPLWVSADERISYERNELGVWRARICGYGQTSDTDEQLLRTHDLYFNTAQLSLRRLAARVHEVTGAAQSIKRLPSLGYMIEEAGLVLYHVPGGIWRYSETGSFQKQAHHRWYDIIGAGEFRTRAAALAALSEARDMYREQPTSAQL